MLHMPFPSLLSLDVVFENPTLFLNSLESFLKSPPKIRKLCIRMCPREAAIGDIDANYITRWQNLQSVFCPQVALDMNLLVPHAYPWTTCGRAWHSAVFVNYGSISSGT